MLTPIIENTNTLLLAGHTFCPQERSRIVLSIVSSLPADIDSVIKKQRFSRADAMYPLFFEPQSKKQRLITGEQPSTVLLAANAYELELMRLLALWGMENPVTRLLVETTKRRLACTCFGRFCATGECAGASMAALRFYSAQPQPDIHCIATIVSSLKPHRDGSGLWNSGLNLPKWYTLLALSTCPHELAVDELQYCTTYLWNLLNKPLPANDRNTRRKNIVRCALSRTLEYRFLAHAYFEPDTAGLLQMVIGNHIIHS